MIFPLPPWYLAPTLPPLLLSDYSQIHPRLAPRSVHLVSDPLLDLLAHQPPSELFLEQDRL